MKLSLKIIFLRKKINRIKQIINKKQIFGLVNFVLFKINKMIYSVKYVKKELNHKKYKFGIVFFVIMKMIVRTKSVKCASLIIYQKIYKFKIKFRFKMTKIF